MGVCFYLKRVVHLYFNCDSGEMSSGCLNSTFRRHIQFAFRMLIGFSLSCLICYGPILKNHFSLQFMIPNLTILILQETFGLTFLTNLQLLLILIPLSIYLFLIQKFDLNNYHYLLSEFFYFSSCFIISYQCKEIPTRKLSLLFNSIYFSTIINQKETEKYFSFRLLEHFSIGMFISVIVCLIVFPLFSTFDIENRFNYCLIQLEQMYQLIIEAFLSEQKINANLLLSRVKIIEKFVRNTLIVIQTRFKETSYEPSKLLKILFNRKKKFLIDLNLQEEEDLICSLLINICTLELIVKECEYNEYHREFQNELRTSLLNLSLNQSSFLTCLLSYKKLTRHQLLNQLNNLQLSFDSIRSSYIQMRLKQIKSSFQSSQLSIQSEDHLIHSAFIYHLSSIVRLLTKSILINPNNSIQKSKRKFFHFDCSRFLSSLKTTIIIAVGSIFVMIPNLAQKFENGQWILIALCMTQGDTVGGALTTMKMRLIGTLMGAMWAYITYITAGNDVYKTYLMLCPWIFFCGYMKLYPQWGYTVTVAASTPIVVNLGRLPYADSLPAGNYALLRIQQNLIGISIGLILAISIFPVFAIDLLKENIHCTLELCRKNVDSIVQIYNKVFHHDENSEENVIDLSKVDDIKYSIDVSRRSFHQLISLQRTLVVSAAIEPSFFWLNNGFSNSRYKTLVQQQIDIYRMLNNINSALFRINECSNIDEKHLENLRIHAANGLFLPDLPNEIHNLSKKLNNCLEIWSSYFSLTQTKSSQISRGSIKHRKHLIKNDLNKYEQCLFDLHRMISYLQNQHQNSINQLLKHYFQRFSSGELPEHFIPYVYNDQADLIFIALSAMYYSITQLAKAALALGTTIHQVFELEITDLYQPF